ncbi:MAG: hypothetical protein ACJ72N_21095 [Labedaea sp.]
MTDDDPIPPPPTATTREKAHGVALAILGEFPGGSTVVGILDQIFGAPYARRHEAWLRKMHELLIELDARGIDLEGLGERPEFVTAVHDATRIALGEHLEAKLDLLKAVLLNAATHPPDPITDMWTLRYLRWIDELEPAHVTILAFGVDPRGWLEAQGKETPDYISGGRRTVFDLAQWPYAPDVIDLILEDLARLQLGSLSAGMVTGRAMYDPWISNRGSRFLEWLAMS